MGVNYSEIQELLQQRADIQARLNLMPTTVIRKLKKQAVQSIYISEKE